MVRWNRRRRRLNSIEEVALRVVPRNCRVFSILWSCLCRRFTKIVPEVVLFAEIHLATLPRNLRSSMPFGPLVLSIGVMERITHLWYAICAIRNVKRRITLLEMLGEGLSVG
jgi:hypothetical protein